MVRSKSSVKNVENCEKPKKRNKNIKGSDWTIVEEVNGFGASFCGTEVVSTAGISRRNTTGTGKGLVERKVFVAEPLTMSRGGNVVNRAFS
jgi:hypothetical protein